MKTYKISTSATSTVAQRMFLVSADDPKQVLAWFAMNYGLACVDVDSIVEATAEDQMYYSGAGGRVHQTNARQRNQLLGILDAGDLDEHEKEAQKLHDDLQAAKERKPTYDEAMAIVKGIEDAAVQSMKNVNLGEGLELRPATSAETQATTGTDENKT